MHAYTKELAGRIAATDRARYTTIAGPAQRFGKLFIDYLRNGRGCTAIGAWSPRARKSLPVAMPTTWKQVEGGAGPAAFSLSSVSAARMRAAKGQPIATGNGKMGMRAPLLQR